MLDWEHRLVRPIDFRQVSRRGLRRAGAFVTVWLLRTDRGHLRAGIVVTKATGNAVVRNRLKRRLRHSLSRWADVISADIVVRAQPLSATSHFGQLDEELQRLVVDLVGKGASE